MVLTVGLAAAIVPAQASLSFNTGDSGSGSLTTAISNWNTATGLAYASDDFTFTGSTSGTPATYTDATTGVVFTGYAGSGSGGSVVTGSQTSLTVSSGTLVDSSAPAIIKITGFAANTSDFAFEFKTAFAGTGLFCIGVNESSFSESGACDETFSMSAGSTGFVGIVDTSAAISTLWIGPLNGQAQTIALQNFYAPSADSATPETSTLLMLGAGLILLGMFRAKRPAAARS